MVLVIFEYVKINRSVAFICISGVKDLLHQIDLLDDVSRCARLDRRRCYVEHAHGLMIGQSTSLHDFHRLELLKPCLLCDLVLSLVSIVLKMSYVCDVAYITHLVAEMRQKLYEYVISDTRTSVSEMCVAINCRASDIKAYASFVDGLEDFLFPSKGIGDI